MPRSEVLLAEYEDARGELVADLAWFRALVLFKMGATTALIVKHRRRVQSEDGVEELASAIGRMVTGALQILA